MIFLERTREGFVIPDEKFNRFKAMLEKLLTDREERIWTFPSA